MNHAEVNASDVIDSVTILVKGTSDVLPAGGHQRIHPPNLGHGLETWRERIEIFDESGDPDTSVIRRKWDSEDEWGDSEARERGRRYWTFSLGRVRGWFENPETMPRALLLGTPAGNRTVVRYAWETDPEGKWEYFPERSRWGVPLGRRLPHHPALGKVLYELRNGRKVQVLLNHSAGWRLLGE